MCSSTTRKAQRNITASVIIVSQPFRTRLCNASRAERATSKRSASMASRQTSRKWDSVQSWACAMAWTSWLTAEASASAPERTIFSLVNSVARDPGECSSDRFAYSDAFSTSFIPRQESAAILAVLAFMLSSPNSRHAANACELISKFLPRKCFPAWFHRQVQMIFLHSLPASPFRKLATLTLVSTAAAVENDAGLSKLSNWTIIDANS
mmetsp:Transcript_8054/g.49737  ORF Transcript_8054/g.49737 Transcript_8054/m.49737 type:complete len:209 (-) Transcript_8054:367-993(-)